MITGFIDEIRSNKWLSGIEDITRIAGIIDNTDFSKMEDGTYIMDNGLFYILSTYNTASGLRDKPAEAHRKNIDLQYLVYGEEKAGYADIRNPKKSQQIYDEKNDIELFSRIDNESFITLKNFTITMHNIYSMNSSSFICTCFSHRLLKVSHFSYTIF